MKHILKIMVMLVVSLLLFTGCDQILEAFYPEYGDTGGRSGDNTIQIRVDLDRALGDANTEIWAKLEYAFGDYENENRDLFLYDQSAWPMIEWDDKGEPKYYVNFDFWGLEDAEYRVIVWVDKDPKNWVPDWDEPQMEAVWEYPEYPDDPNNEYMITDNIFRFPNSMQTNWINAYAFLGGGARVDHSFNVFGDFVINSSDRNSREFRAETVDPAQKYWELHVNIYDENMGWIDGRDEWYPEPQNNGAVFFDFNKSFRAISMVIQRKFLW